eukprot:6919958-Prymnesium_polylepis.1
MGSWNKDLGCGPRIEWYEAIDAHAKDSGSLTAPIVRHLWGESQHGVHAGGQELFLDVRWWLLHTAQPSPQLH